MATFEVDLYLQNDRDVQVPAHVNFGKFMLDRLRRMGDEVALECSDTGEKLSYKELTQYAVDLSKSLMKLGVGRGDVVAVGSEKRIMFIPTALAIIFTGASYTPYEEISGRAALRHKMSVAKPTHFICSKLFWDINADVLKENERIKTFITFDDAPTTAIAIESMVSEHYDVDRFEPAEVQGQADVAVIMYSSGTTGMSKGIALTHMNFILLVYCANYDFFKEKSYKIIYLEGEWYHMYDTLNTFRFLFLGKTIVYPNNETPETILNCIQDYKVGLAMLTPAWINLILLIEDWKYNVDTLKMMFSSTSPLHYTTIEKVKERFPNVKHILQHYGMTEAPTTCSEIWCTKGPKPGSVGRVYPGLTLKIVDPKTDKVLGPNEHGEIRIKGPIVMKGYIDVDRSTYVDHQGFFMTGDLGFYDEDGYIFIVDRLKDIIMSHGLNIAPLELERILLQHPGVRDAAVVGKPVPVYGEFAAAFVVRQPGATVTEQELIDYVDPEVPKDMRLKGGVRFISEIPRNPMRKVLRTQLRDMLNDTN